MVKSKLTREQIFDFLEKRNFNSYIDGEKLYFANYRGKFTFFSDKELTKPANVERQKTLSTRAFLSFLSSDSVNFSSTVAKFINFKNQFQLCSLYTSSRVRMTSRKLEKVFKEFSYLNYGRYSYFKNPLLPASNSKEQLSRQDYDEFEDFILLKKILFSNFYIDPRLDAETKVKMLEINLNDDLLRFWV